MNRQEALELIESEKGFPVKSKVFRDVRDNTFHTQVNIFDLKYMEEFEGVKE
jgi:hypothetical protein